MMTAQIANGGFAVKPKIIVDSNPISYEDAKQSMESGLLFDKESDQLLDKKLFKLIIDRHDLRNKQSNFERITV